MDKDKYGVHRTHCCKKHGCKYNDEDCPVALGEIEQEYKECQVGHDLDEPCDNREMELLNRIKEALFDLTSLAEGYGSDYIEFSEWLEKRSQDF